MTAANARSDLLNEEENQTVFTIVGHRKQSKATAVVQMFHAHPDQSSWTKFKTGVVCFVKDNSKKSYYIRLIDISAKAMVYEQEVYNQFTYKKDRPYFHSFPGDKFMVGLNFADNDEASAFYQAVNTKLQEKHERKQSTLRREQQQSGPQMIGKPMTNTVVGGADPFAGGNKIKPKFKGTGKLLKSAIGAPTEFCHLSHVGFDPSTGAFDSSNIDPQWKRLLDSVGVTNEQLKDQNTATFIYDFVEKHGGIQEANRQLEEANKKNRGPPPPPSRGNTSRGGGRGLPPPPPRGRSGPPPPPSSHRSVGSAPAPPPPPPIGAPAPPPPPPVGGLGPPGPPKPPSAAGGPPPPPSRDNKPAPSSGGGRGDLLASIRAGFALKPVDQQDHGPPPEASSGGGGGGLDGMAGALAKALAARQQVIQGSDDEDENEEDDEWGDDDDWGSS